MTFFAISQKSRKFIHCLLALSKKNQFATITNDSKFVVDLKRSDSLMRGVKQIHDQLNSVEEMLLVQPPSSNHKQNGKSQRNTKHNNGISAAEV